MIYLFDMAPLGGGIGLFAAVAFFFIFAIIAFVAFKALKKTVRMTIRMALVAFILLVAIVGSVAFWYLGSGPAKRPERPRPVQPR